MWVTSLELGFKCPCGTLRSVIVITFLLPCASPGSPLFTCCLFFSPWNTVLEQETFHRVHAKRQLLESRFLLMGFTSYTSFSIPTKAVLVLGEALGRAGKGWRGCERRGMLRKSRSPRERDAEGRGRSKGGSLAEKRGRGLVECHK